MSTNGIGGPEIRKATKGIVLLTISLLLFSGMPSLLSYYYDYARNSPNEVGFAYNDNNEVIWIKHGDADYITIDLYDRLFLRGLHFVHNHPNGSGFSRADINTCEDVGCSSVEVITQDYSDDKIDFTMMSQSEIDNYLLGR